MALPKSNLVAVGGVGLPQPTTYDLKFIDVDSSASGRNDSGYMLRDRVRHDIASISLTWTMIEKEDLEAIRSAIEPSSFEVRYYDGRDNICEMYAGDRQVSMICIPSTKSGYNMVGDARWNMSVDLIAL